MCIVKIIGMEKKREKGGGLPEIEDWLHHSEEKGVLQEKDNIPCWLAHIYLLCEEGFVDNCSTPNVSS